MRSDRHFHPTRRRFLQAAGALSASLALPARLAFADMVPGERLYGSRPSAT